MTRTGIGFQRGLFDNASFGTQHNVVAVDIVFVFEVFDVDIGHYLIVGRNADDVLNGTTLGLARAFGNVEHPHPVATTFFGKEQHVVVHRSHKHVFKKIFAAHIRAFHALAATRLTTIFAQRRAFEIAQMRNGNHHVFVGNGVFYAEVGRVVHNARTPFVAVFLFHLQGFGLDYFHTLLFVGQEFFAVGNKAFQFGVFLLNLFAFEAGELTEAHFHNSLGLHVAQLEGFHQGGLGGVYRFGGPNHLDYFVHVVQGNQQTLQDMGAFFVGRQFVFGAANHHLVAVFHIIMHQVAQIQKTRTAMHQGNVIDAERRLQRGKLIEFVENNVGHRLAFEFKNNAQTVAVRLVANVANAVYFLFFHQIGNFLNHFRFVDLIRNRGNDNVAAAVVVGFDGGFPAHDHAAHTGKEGLFNAVVTVNHAARGKVGGFDVLHQLFGGDVALVDIGHNAVAHFGKVVGGHVGGHTHRNTGPAVHEQVGNFARQDRGFLKRIVEVVLHIDRIFVDIGHQLFGKLTHTRFGITHGRGRVLVDRPEVTLTVHQRIAHRPILGHTHQSTIYRTVAVRVILTQHIPHNTCRLFIGVTGGNPVFVHRKENTPVNRLHTIAYIRQGARNNNRHGVVDVGRLHLIFDVYRHNTTDFRCVHFFHTINITLSNRKLLCFLKTYEIRHNKRKKQEDKTPIFPQITDNFTQGLCFSVFYRYLCNPLAHSGLLSQTLKD